MHHMNTVRNVAAGLREVLQQEQAPTDNTTIIPEPVNHVANAVQITQKQLANQLQKIQAMMQTMHIQYSAAPQHTRKVYGVSRYHGGNNNFCGRVVHGDQRRVNCKCGHGSWINSDLHITVGIA